MRHSALLEIDVTAGDTITMTVGWLEVTSIVETKEIHRNIIGVTDSATYLSSL
jgi:hypothetical protein